MNMYKNRNVLTNYIYRRRTTVNFTYLQWCARQSWVGVGILGRYRYSVFFGICNTDVGIGIGILKYRDIGIVIGITDPGLVHVPFKPRPRRDYILASPA